MFFFNFQILHSDGTRRPISIIEINIYYLPKFVFIQRSNIVFTYQLHTQIRYSYPDFIFV